MTWVGPWQTTDYMEKRLLHALLPKLEFVLFAQLRWNLLQQEVHAGLSPLPETEREALRTNP